MIYFDNNAGTLMPPQVISEIGRWYNTGNPSASYASARDCVKMMDAFRQFLQEHYGADMDVIFTSSASESNATIIRSVVDASQGVPHIISSNIEHKSILDCLETLKKAGAITYTLVPARENGMVWAMDVEAAILRSTEKPALVTIMHANNETGVLNNISEVSKVCKKFGVPFHSDVVQTAGKLPWVIKGAGADALSFTFHKCLGPVCGALMINRQLRRKLNGIIGGTQNGGFRGGTENVPMIGGAFAGLKLTLGDRRAKNEKMMGLKKTLLGKLAARFRVIPLSKYNMAMCREVTIVVLGENTLPSTLLISVILPGPPNKMCNSKLKEYLGRKGIIVSIGSACNTSSAKASHVLYAMGADERIRRGTIRISFGDYNTTTECEVVAAVIAEFISFSN